MAENLHRHKECSRHEPNQWDHHDFHWQRVNRVFWGRNKLCDDMKSVTYMKRWRICSFWINKSLESHVHVWAWISYTKCIILIILTTNIFITIIMTEDEEWKKPLHHPQMEDALHLYSNVLASVLKRVQQIVKRSESLCMKIKAER